MFFLRFLGSGASISEIIVSVVAIILAAATAIVFHEVSHGFVAMKNGDYTAKSRGRLSLNPVVHFDLIGLLMILLVGFGWAKPVPIDPRNFNNYKKGMIMVSLSGVITNILLGGFGLLLLYLLNPVIGHYYTTTPAIVIMLKMFAYYYIVYLVSINFMLAFFNMLPIYPLDGFRFLNMFLKPGNAYSSFMQRYGFFVLIGILLIGNVFRRLGIWYLDIFGMIANLITKLIFLVV